MSEKEFLYQMRLKIFQEADKKEVSMVLLSLIQVSTIFLEYRLKYSERSLGMGKEIIFKR